MRLRIVLITVVTVLFATCTSKEECETTYRLYNKIKIGWSKTKVESTIKCEPFREKQAPGSEIFGNDLSTKSYYTDGNDVIYVNYNEQGKVISKEFNRKDD